MTVSTLPIWVILSIAGLVLLIFISQINYYLPSIGKLKAQCLSEKSSRQRSNYILELKQRLDETYYWYIAAVIYVIASVCFCIENRKLLFVGDYVILRIVVLLILWVIMAILAISFVVGLAMLCQKNAIQSLKEHYQRHYGVTVVSLDTDSLDEYRELSEELSRE